MEQDNVVRKLYLDSRLTKGAIAQLNEEQVKIYFSQFGEVSRINLLRAKGVGFVDVTNPTREITMKIHQIEGHEIDVQESEDRKADPRKQKAKKFYLDSRLTKGSIAELSDDQVKAYFSQFGEVTRVNLVGLKGIGFIDFSEPVSDIDDKNHTISGHEINVKKSDDRKADPRKRKRRWGNWRKNKRAKW